MDILALEASIGLDTQAFLSGVGIARDALVQLDELAEQGLRAPLSGLGDALSAELQAGAKGPFDVNVTADPSPLIASIERALSSHAFTIDVTGRYAGTTGAPTEKNARAMASGRIFTKPTVFGYADGAYQIAGDAGAEAVVGVNSLGAMIRESVQGAMANAVTALTDAISAAQGGNMVMQLDSGALVGALVREIDAGLGSLSVYRNGVRA